MTLEQSETHWPLSYNNDGLLIGPLRMVQQQGPSGPVWVYCWHDPGVAERVHEECRAVTDFSKPRHGR